MGIECRARGAPGVWRVSLDIETFSSVDLARAGVYRYAEAPDFCVLLIGYSFDGGPVCVADLASGDVLPPELLMALLSPSVERWAFNAETVGTVLFVSPIDRGEVYSGCYGQVSLSFFAFNTNGNRGIACGLNNIQKLRDGDPLGGLLSAE